MLSMGFVMFLHKNLHLNLNKQRYIVGSSTCSFRPLSLLLTKILTAVKGLKSQCFTKINIIITFICVPFIQPFPR